MPIQVDVPAPEIPTMQERTPAPEPERPKRSLREGRGAHIKPQDIGRMTLYTFKDVLDYAYSVGFKRFGKPEVMIENTLDANGNPQSTAIVAVAAIFMEPSFDPWAGIQMYHEVECWGIGDANFENTGNKNIGQHFVRMAETRAKGRALAHALNLDANFAEEMGETEATVRSAPTRAPASNNTSSSVTEDMYPPHNTEGGWVCEETGEKVTGKNAYWSLRKYGRILSWDEQKKLQNG